MEQWTVARGGQAKIATFDGEVYWRTWLEAEKHRLEEAYGRPFSVRRTTAGLALFGPRIAESVCEEVA